jgi:hypothetical protein
MVYLVVSGIVDSGSGRDTPLNPHFGITGGMVAWVGVFIVEGDEGVTL